MESPKKFKTPDYVRKAVNAYRARNQDKIKASKHAYYMRKKLEAKALEVKQIVV